MPKLSVLVHHNHRSASSTPYILSECLPRWKANGIEVEIIKGLAHPDGADILFAHIDVTRLPLPYVRLLSSHPVVINGRVRDISKRRISTQLVDRASGHQGPVIVKTDLNAGGESGPDRSELAARRVLPLGVRRRIKRLLRQRHRKTSWRKTRTLRSARYPIYESIAEVPNAILRNESLVIERFVPEIEDDLYCLRSYCFLGRESVTVRVRSRHPIVKAGRSVDTKVVDVHPHIEARRRELGFDYGKFDYVVHEGEAILLDANTTPVFGRTSNPRLREVMVRTLAAGIDDWLPVTARG